MGLLGVFWWVARRRFARTVVLWLVVRLIRLIDWRRAVELVVRGLGRGRRAASAASANRDESTELRRNSPYVRPALLRSRAEGSIRQTGPGGWYVRTWLHTLVAPEADAPTCLCVFAGDDLHRRRSRCRGIGCHDHPVQQRPELRQLSVGHRRRRPRHHVVHRRRVDAGDREDHAVGHDHRIQHRPQPRQRAVQHHRRPDGTMWFTDDGSVPAIGKITPSGTITEYSTGLNSGSMPYWITLGGNGDIWFTDIAEDRGQWASSDRQDNAVRHDHRVHRRLYVLRRAGRSGVAWPGFHSARSRRAEPVVQRPGLTGNRQGHRIRSDHRVLPPTQRLKTHRRRSHRA